MPAPSISFARLISQVTRMRTALYLAAILAFAASGFSAEADANRFVQVTKSDVNGHFFSQVIYAPSVRSLVSWGTRTHAQKM